MCAIYDPMIVFPTVQVRSCRELAAAALSGQGIKTKVSTKLLLCSHCHPLNDNHDMDCFPTP